MGPCTTSSISPLFVQNGACFCPLLLNFLQIGSQARPACKVVPPAVNRRKCRHQAKESAVVAAHQTISKQFWNSHYSWIHVRTCIQDWQAQAHHPSSFIQRPRLDRIIIFHHLLLHPAAHQGASAVCQKWVNAAEEVGNWTQPLKIGFMNKSVKRWLTNMLLCWSMSLLFLGKHVRNGLKQTRFIFSSKKQSTTYCSFLLKKDKLLIPSDILELTDKLPNHWIQTKKQIKIIYSRGLITMVTTKSPIVLYFSNQLCWQIFH